jgi:hypothetical protein
MPAPQEVGPLRPARQHKYLLLAGGPFPDGGLRTTRRWKARRETAQTVASAIDALIRERSYRQSTAGFSLIVWADHAAGRRMERLGMALRQPRALEASWPMV